MFDFEKELKNLPENPGVYLMHDKTDKIIYVGKAKVLKNRVRQYFHKDTNHTPKVKKMISNIARFEYIITDSESEALALECNLIKKYRPKYNILLKDDKHFPYIKITMQDAWPRLIITRRQEKDGAKYFGPYPSMDMVKKNLAVLRSIFKIPTCQKQFPRDIGRGRSCINYQMDKCFAPCIGTATQEEYYKTYEAVCSFLTGKHKDLIEAYREQMAEAASQLLYEKAASYRDKIAAIEALSNRQKAIMTGGENEDVLGIAREKNICFVLVFFVREGRVVGRREMRIDEADDLSDGAILSAFIKQFYADTEDIPRYILSPCDIEDGDSIAIWLSQKRDSRVQILIPQRGDKVKMVQMVAKNARLSVQHFMLTRLKQETAQKNIALLAEAIGYEGRLRRIEAYDISNISGTNSVGGMVVFIDGAKRKSEYRRFKIQYVDGPDDYASMSEVLYRRFSHEARVGDDHFSDMPDLILMDGGIGHVHVAQKVLFDLGLNFPVYGMVKDDKHRTRGLVDGDGHEVNLNPTGAAFMLIARIQEEVHNYAISYHKHLRKKAMVKSELDEVPGIGAKRKEMLLKTFSSVENIKKATVDELCAVPSMNREAAVNLYTHFRKRGE